MLPKPVSARGPWWHRFFIRLFTVLLVLLAYWTLGFLLDDIGQWNPPDREAIRRVHVAPELERGVSKLDTQVNELRTRQQQVRSQQSILQDSTANSQRTMQQMAELDRLRLQKNEPPSPAQQEAIAEAQKQFLQNQREYQAKSEELTRLDMEVSTLVERLNDAREKLTAAERPAENEYQRRYERWQLQVAAVKIGLMLPLLAAAAWAFRRYRSSIYAPLAHAFGIAVSLKTLVVMHEYFPAAYFKYILIGASLAATVWLLVKLVRMAARPQAAWLRKQYREAYEAFLCPVCDFPIRRGPLKYLSWTRNSIKRLSMRVSSAATNEPDELYTCPSCGTKLFEECSSCHGVRHSLLPACSHCGQEQETS